MNGRFAGASALHDVEQSHAPSAALVGNGAMYAGAPGKGITAHREPGDVLHTYVALRQPLDWFVTIDFTNPTQAGARIAAEFDGWAPALLSLITDGGTPLALRPLHTLPSDHRWPRVRGVTLLGDAAHLLPPSGEGANLALFDGAELAKAIVAHPSDVERALGEYEAAMFQRAHAEAVDAHELLDLCFGERAPFSLVDLFARGAAARRDQLTSQSE